MRWILLAFLLPLSVATGTATEPPRALSPGGVAGVVEVVDGDTLRLDDGREVRLVGLQAPKLPLGRRNFEAWPLAEESKTALEQLTLGRRIALSFGGREIDRHRRVLAHLHDEEGRWIQGEMLRAGMARVYSFSDNRTLVREMQAIEEEARRAGRGIWAHPYYRVRPAESVERDIGTFQLVEGTVYAVAQPRGTTFINFDEDWRTDFTIRIQARHRRLFEDSDIDLDRLQGSRVRVRGWLDSYYGPMIDATHPEQIELLR